MLPDFVLLPPEINSARMYAGPRSGSMWAAAAAWDKLAAQLGSSASSFQSTVSSLTGGAWQGPASMTMASAAAPYVQWLTATSVNLTYYFMPTAQLPLLDPLRMLPILGNPLADLLQPFLKPIVDLGYAPGLLPGLNPLSVAGYVGQGATAGIASPLVAGLPPLVSNSVASGF
jgi:hypothetical protein